MSHQPSTADQLKDKAQTLYATIANTIAPASTENQSAEERKRREVTKDDQGQACEKDSYQDQLNNAARGTKSLKQEEETVFEKVVSTVPGLSKLQSKNADEESTESNSTDTKNSGVTRPDNDVQVEEFLRKQYSSKKDLPRKDKN